jgi:1-acyl-sn-glycerol-3-phosphate acyltransferase
MLYNSKLWLGKCLIVHIVFKSSLFMFWLLQFVLYVWQFVFGLKGNSNSAKCGQHLVRSVANNKLNL